MLKTAVVTGASRGIGKSIARRLASRGLNVVINYLRSEKEALALERELLNAGLSALAIRADVSDRGQVGEMMRRCEGRFSGADVVINNAGISEQRQFQDISPAMWERMFAVHVTGAYNVIQCALTHMIHEKRGSIVNVSSVFGLAGGSCEAHYSAAKAALIGLTKALSKELGPSGIRVNCAAPGYIRTDMTGALTQGEALEIIADTALLRAGTPEDVAAAVEYLALDASFVTGQVLPVTGGFIL